MNTPARKFSGTFPRLDRVARISEAPSSSRRAIRPPASTEARPAALATSAEVAELQRQIEELRESTARLANQNQELRARVNATHPTTSYVPAPRKSLRTDEDSDILTNDRLDVETYYRLRSKRNVEGVQELIIRMMPTLQTNAPDARGVTTQEIRHAVKGGHRLTRESIDLLVASGHLRAIRGKGREVFHRLTTTGKKLSDLYKE